MIREMLQSIERDVAHVEWQQLLFKELAECWDDKLIHKACLVDARRQF